MDPVQPNRFRRRLTVAFVLVASLSAGLLALGSYVTTREYRVRAFRDRSEDQARINVAVVPEEVTPDRLRQLLEVYRGQGGFETVAVLGDTSLRSSPEIGIEEVPPDLFSAEGDAPTASAMTRVGTASYFVVGTTRGAGDTLFFFFPADDVHRSLEEMRAVLLSAWLVVTALAAVVGHVIARRTLTPVAQASRAARRLAEGTLDIRIPVTTEDEFGAWARCFNEMAAALEAKIADLGHAHARERRFTADVAHELRTPVTAMLNEAALLAQRRSALPPDAGRLTELLLADATRLRRLVEDLLELSRMDAGAADVRPEPLDLSASLASIVDAVDAHRVVELHVVDAQITTDARRLERVLNNLVTNALKHGNGEVVVRAGPLEDGSVGVEVSNAGSIPPDALPHLTERFYKRDPARTHDGSGLGLAIVNENVRLLGGHLRVASEGGRTTFAVRLPQLTEAGH